MLGGKSDEGANSYVPPSDSKPFANESTQTMQTPIQEQSKSIPEIDIDDDEIPF
jgi:single-stranded DNA-binding protein